MLSAPLTSRGGQRRSKQDRQRLDGRKHFLAIGAWAKSGGGSSHLGCRCALFLGRLSQGLAAHLVCQDKPRINAGP